MGKMFGHMQLLNHVRKLVHIDGGVKFTLANIIHPLEIKYPYSFYFPIGYVYQLVPIKVTLYGTSVCSDFHSITNTTIWHKRH